MLDQIRPRRTLYYSLDPPLREPRIKISEPLSAFLEAKRIECQWAVAKRYMYTCNPLQTALFEARATLSIRYSRCPVQLYPLLALPRAGIYLSGTSFLISVNLASFSASVAPHLWNDPVPRRYKNIAGQ